MIDSELSAATKTLNVNIDNLSSAIDELNSRFGTPVGTTDTLLGTALHKFEPRGLFYLNISNPYTTDGFGPIDANPICYVGNGEYMIFGADGSGNNYLVKIYEDGSSSTLWSATTYTYAYSITYIRDSDSYYLGVTAPIWDGSHTVLYLYIYDVDGNVVKTFTFSSSLIGHSYFGSAYDYSTGKFYLVSYPVVQAQQLYSLDITLSPTGGTDDSLLVEEFQLPDFWTGNGSYAPSATMIGTSLMLVSKGGDVEWKGDWYIMDMENEAAIIHGLYPVHNADLATLGFYYVTYNFDKHMIMFATGNQMGGTVLMEAFSLDFAQLENIVGPNQASSVSVDDGANYVLNVQPITIDGSVSLSSSALPSGAATEAKQDTQITSLQTIEKLLHALESVNTDSLVINRKPSQQNVTALTTITDVATIFETYYHMMISNLDTENTIWIGDSLVTISNGFALYPLESIVIENWKGSSASIYGICEAGKTASLASNKFTW